VFANYELPFDPFDKLTTGQANYGLPFDKLRAGELRITLRQAQGRRVTNYELRVTNYELR